MGMESAAKRCPACGQHKPAEQFGKNRATKDGLYVYCRACDGIRCARYTAANGQRRRENARRWYENNKERARQSMREYARQNPEVNRRAVQRFKQVKPERLRQIKTDWREANRGKDRASKMLHLARQWGVRIGDLKAIEAFYTHVAEALNIPCHYCKEPVAREDREIDHMTPFARRGAHAIENLCCACGGCNRAKGDMTAEEFLAQMALPF